MTDAQVQESSEGVVYHEDGTISVVFPINIEAELLRYEAGLIQRALYTAGGSVTRAASILDVTHQGLAFILNGRHKALLDERTPIRHRRKKNIKE